MGTSNNKRIEETAINQLEAELLLCPFLESFINRNDKTPSWDGYVSVYKSDSHRKENFFGRAPIQIKGTEQNICSERPSCSCEVSDLRNYYRDGGCLFFFISVNTPPNIYYSSLHVFDLKKILDKAGHQKTTTIYLDKFHQKDPGEMTSIFIDFIENSRKQHKFINKEIPSLEQLQSNIGVIDSFSFCIYNLGRKIDNIANYISLHRFYLYAKEKGICNSEIPVYKISDAIVSTLVPGKVMVKDTEYFPSFIVQHEKGKQFFLIGKGIRLSFDSTNKKASMNYKPTGTLSDFIQDVSCLFDMTENQEITLNGIRIPFNGMDNVDLSECKDYFQNAKEIKRTLDLLGVTEELQCENLSDEDDIILGNLVNAVLYNQKFDFSNTTDTVIQGPIKIANLSIWIWAIRQEDGYYQLENFFKPHNTVFFEEDDIARSNPIPASHYLLLNKEAFIHTSNMNYEEVEKDICSMNHHPLLIGYVTFLMLNVLLGYDEQREKDDRLLDLAKTICDWIALDKQTDREPFLRLNQLQIEKRRRPLTILENIELGKFTDTKYSADIRCGAFLLLGASEEAQKCFDELSPEKQKEFITYPICHFGKLIQKETP